MSLDSLIDKIDRVTGHVIERRYDPARRVDIHSITADITSARAAFDSVTHHHPRRRPAPHMAVVFNPGLNAPAHPRVSVCIANFNGEALLVDCIESVLAQDTDAAIEILVHDDASGDGSLALLKARYPQVHVLASAENVGFCIGNNRMVDAARGEFVLLLNNDAALETDAISSLLCEAGRLGTASILTLPQYDWQTGQLVDRGRLLDPFFNPIPNLAPACTDVAFVIGACPWCPRQLWNSLGGFPERMESIAEDLYLCGIARLRGIPVRALAASGYRHRQGATFGGNRAGAVGWSPPSSGGD